MQYKNVGFLAFVILFLSERSALVLESRQAGCSISCWIAADVHWSRTGARNGRVYAGIPYRNFFFLNFITALICLSIHPSLPPSTYVHLSFFNFSDGTFLFHLSIRAFLNFHLEHCQENAQRSFELQKTTELCHKVPSFAFRFRKIWVLSYKLVQN
jgi:hypothetical protein